MYVFVLFVNLIQVKLCGILYTLVTINIIIYKLLQQSKFKLNMNKPIQFISIDKDGTCFLTEQAEKILSDIDGNLAIVCVAGLYRTGKSYLLNRLLGRQDGFEIGPTINSCTKGLWIWGEPIDLPERDLKVLLIDTEGLGSAFEDRNETIDMEIFCLGVLLSSMFIYNSMKNIDEGAIESLYLVINFAKRIQSSFKDVDSYSNNFPSFLWVLRDFALELIDSNGKKLTPTQYLENALKTDESDDSEVMKKNEIRGILKTFFKERDCYTIIRPINDEKKLRNIDKIPVKELRPEFVTQMDKLVAKVFNMVRPKLVQGSFLNGKMYLNLVRMYISSLNNNSLPDVKTSWKIVVDQQMEEIYDKSVRHYVDEMLSIDYNTITKLEDLVEYHNKFKLIAYDYLKDFANINVPITVYIEFMKRLDQKLQDQFDTFVQKWKDLSKKQCEAISKNIIEEYRQNNDVTDIITALDLVEDVFKVVDESMTSENKYSIIYPVLIDFFVGIFKKGFNVYKGKTDMAIKNLNQEKDHLQGVIEKQRDNFEQAKDDYESQIKELKETHLNLRLDVMGFFNF
jgi:hypothetical protein